MKAKGLLLMLLVSFTVSAQLTISPGSQFSLRGNIQLTLRNIDLINNGNFVTGAGIASFTGTKISSISGSQPIQFFQIEINKTNNEVRLLRTISVTNRVLFTSGFLNLNGFDADLGNSGLLDGEQENARVTGLNGGQVLFNTDLGFPTNANPANLGILITANQDLGNITIRRGHQAQVINPSPGTSILRYFDILPTNNTNLNATLRFKYFEGELLSIDENSLALFESTDGTNWSAIGFTSRDTATDFVDKTGIGSLSRFTLTSPNNGVLPVRFTGFNVKCEGAGVLISWKTAQEHRSNRFDIEKSDDGIRWTVIGNLPATGNNNGEKTYSFADNNPFQNGYYRIAQYDLDGRVEYTGILRSSCEINDDESAFWPNPFHEIVFINIVTNNESMAIIKVFDNKGALVKLQKSALLRGSNQLRVDLGAMANGIYSLYTEWNNGHMKKTVQVWKQ